jgi:hypothetical protein
MPSTPPHWEELGLGSSPFTVTRRIYDEGLARRYGLALGFCDVCTGPTEESWLVTSSENRSFLACPDCIRARGSKLHQKQMRADSHARGATAREFERLAALRRKGML